MKTWEDNSRSEGLEIGIFNIAFSVICNMLDLGNMKILLIMCAIFAFTSAYIQTISEWNAYKRRYQKEYKIMEDIDRKRYYYVNKDRIREHNVLYESGKSTYKLAINQFADWTEQEFYSIFQTQQRFFDVNETTKWIGIMDRPRIRYWQYHSSKKRYVSHDWRETNSVNPVRDQTFMGKSQCNAGWAFAAVATIEGHDSKYPAGLQKYSEQNLLDCISPKYGCHGMGPRNAFSYILNQGNINSRDSYSYKGKSSECHYSEDDYGTSGVEIFNVKPRDESELLDVVTAEGPVAVGFDPLNFGFMFYSSGVYKDPKCKTSFMNQLHHMVIVGYDTDEEFGDYWIVRNSFGTVWGEDGYIKVPRDVNQCGIAISPVYLII